MHWLRNAWYMAGWSEEVGAAGLSRQVIGKQLFLIASPMAAWRPFWIAVRTASRHSLWASAMAIWLSAAIMG